MVFSLTPPTMVNGVLRTAAGLFGKPFTGMYQGKIYTNGLVTGTEKIRYQPAPAKYKSKATGALVHVWITPDSKKAIEGRPDFGGWDYSVAVAAAIVVGGPTWLNGVLMTSAGPMAKPYTGIYQGKKYKEGKELTGSITKEPITTDMPVTGDASMPTGTPANPPAVPKEIAPPPPATPTVKQASIGGADLKTVAMIAVPLIVLGLILRR